MAVVKNLMVRAGADFSGLKKEMEKSQKAMNTFKEKMNSALKGIGVALATLGSISYLKGSIEAYDYQIEQETKLAVVMRQRMGATEEMIQSVKDLASEQQKLGVIGDEVQLAGAQQLSTFLKSSDALKSLIPAMNNLAAQQKGVKATGEDMINIGNMMGKVMDGQVGALRRVGVSFSAAEEKVLKYGNEQERAAMLAQVITNNVGEMNAALLNTPQGRMQQLMNSYGDFREELGKSVSLIRDLFVPLLQRIVDFATMVAKKLQTVALFINAIFGRSSSTKGQSQATKVTNQQTAAVGGLGDAYKKAGKEAKKAKGSLAGFDEVNSLADKSDAGKEGSKDGGSGAGDIEGISAGAPIDFETNAPEISEKLQALAIKIREVFSNIKSFITEHKDIIIAALSGIGAGIAAYLIATKGATAAKAVWVALTAVLNGLKAAMMFLISPIGLIVVAIAALTAAFVYFYRTNDKFRDFVNNILNKIKDVSINLWKNVLVPFGKFLADVFVAAWDKVKVAGENLWKKVLVPLGDFLGKAFVVAWDATKKAAEWVWKNIFVPLGNFLVWFYKNALLPLGKAIGEVLVSAFNGVSKIAQSFWKNVMVPLGEFLSTVFKTSVSTLSPIFKDLWEKVLVPLGQFLAGHFKNAFVALTEAIKILFNNVLKPLATFLAGHFSKVFDTVFKGIGGYISGLKTAFTGLMTFISGVFSKDWKKAWEGVKQIFKGVFESLWSIAKTPLNLLIDGINTIIGGLNKLSFKLPDWVPGDLGGKGFGINIKPIPKLARGGLVNTATNFGNYIAGEAGTELVMPLENTSFVEKVASAIGIAVGNQLNKNSNSGDIVFKVGETEFGRIAAKSINRAQRTSGRLLLDL